MVGFWTISQHYPLLPGFSPGLGPYFSLERHVSFSLFFVTRFLVEGRVACHVSRCHSGIDGCAAASTTQLVFFFDRLCNAKNDNGRAQNLF